MDLEVDKQKQYREAKMNGKCNICGLPGEVSYIEVDPDTGERKKCKHVVPCLGHPHIHDSMWSLRDKYYPEGKSGCRRITFSEYQMLAAKLRRKSTNAK